jgi:predicted nuclease of predicted toxin-antitoxin system
MIQFLADENFNGRIIRGVLRLVPEIDLIRVQDTTLYQAPDPQVPEWAAQENRILLTHDEDTMIGYANQRLATGLPMPGIFIARRTVPIGQVIDNLLLAHGASSMDEWNNQIRHLPLF